MAVTVIIYSAKINCNLTVMHTDCNSLLIASSSLTPNYFVNISSSPLSGLVFLLNVDWSCNREDARCWSWCWLL